MTKEQKQTIREWLIAQYLSDRKEGYRLMDSVGDLPADYGTYWCYDGVRNLGGGVTRDLRFSVKNHISHGALSRAEMPIVLWRPDEDGTVREYIEQPPPNYPEKCPACSGSGECSHCDGMGMID